jgi:hypothetical protein
MKRALGTLCLLLVATTAFAFDSSKPVERIGVLRGMSDAEETMARALLRELRGRGIEAFDVERTFEELLDEEAVPIARYIVEIRSGEPRTSDYSGIGVGGRHADVQIGIVSSKIAAELRVYDGNTMSVIATENLSKRSTTLMPTSVGIGGSAIYAYVALPFIERAQHRSVARKAAREAASLVVAAMNGDTHKE